MNKFLFIVGFCFLPCLAQGGVFQWVDKDGQVHFGSVPPQQQGEYKVGKIKYDSDSVTSEKDVQEEVVVEKESLEKNSLQGKPVSPPSTNSVEDEETKKAAVSKFHDRKVLEQFIKRLRDSVKTTSDLQEAADAKETPTPQKSEAPEKAQTKVTNPVEENKATAAVADKNAESSNTEGTSVKTSVEKKKVAMEKDADKCGVFTGFVASYEAKVAEGCPGAHCSVYKRSLKRYKLKQKRYC